MLKNCFKSETLIEKSSESIVYFFQGESRTQTSYQPQNTGRRNQWIEDLELVNSSKATEKEPGWIQDPDWVTSCKAKEKEPGWIQDLELVNSPKATKKKPG